MKMRLIFDDDGLSEHTKGQYRRYDDDNHFRGSGAYPPEIDPPHELWLEDSVSNSHDLEFGENFFLGECGNQDEFVGFIKRRTRRQDDKELVGEVQGWVYQKTPNDGYREFDDEPSVYVGDSIQSAATTWLRYSPHGTAGFFAVKVKRRPGSTKNKRNGTIIVPIVERSAIIPGTTKRVLDGKTPKRIS